MSIDEQESLYQSYNSVMKDLRVIESVNTTGTFDHKESTAVHLVGRMHCKIHYNHAPSFTFLVNESLTIFYYISWIVKYPKLSF